MFGRSGFDSFLFFQMVPVKLLNENIVQLTLGMVYLDIFTPKKSELTECKSFKLVDNPLSLTELQLTHTEFKYRTIKENTQSL